MWSLPGPNAALRLPSKCNRCQSNRVAWTSPRVDCPEHIGSCKGCLAWGVYPRHNWTCWSCRWWQAHCPKGHLRLLRPRQPRQRPTSLSPVPRECPRRAGARPCPDLASANNDSQQLFFDNKVFNRRVTPVPDYVRWDGRWSKKNKNQLPLLRSFRLRPRPPLRL